LYTAYIILKSNNYRYAILNYYTLVASEEDMASMTMVNYLNSAGGFCTTVGDDTGKLLQSQAYSNIQLYISKENLLYLGDLDDRFPGSSAFIFLSKHKSTSAIPTLTSHCTGNYAANPNGGNLKELAISSPYLQKQYIKEISNLKSTIPNYQIVIEATHHGPTSLRKPVLFIEIGSTEIQWVDQHVASAVCSSLLRVLRNNLGYCEKVAIALGGTHYSRKFSKLLLESEYGLAAVAAKHNLESIDRDMLDQMITKSSEKVTHIITDWKGLGKEKNRIMGLMENTGLEILRI